MTAILLPLLLAGSAQTAGPELTVMSYNVNFGLGGDKSTLRAIFDGDADVVFLQETTAAWEVAIRSRLKKKYPHMRFRHCCRAGGLAVLSRFPVKHVAYIPAPTRWFPGWLVEVDTPLGTVQALNVHLRPPVSDSGSWVKGYFNTGHYRRQELEHYVGKLKPGMSTLIVGDFNEQRGGALELLLDRGMHNALHEHAPDASTWRWPGPLGTELKQQLDHVFFSKDLDATAARVLDAGRSDHLPVVVRLHRRPPPPPKQVPSSNSSSSFFD